MPWITTTPVLLWAVIFLPAFVLLWIFPPRVKLNGNFGFPEFYRCQFVLYSGCQLGSYKLLAADHPRASTNISGNSLLVSKS